MVYKQPKSSNWSYQFVWNGERFRQSTKQTNKRVAEQIEAAHKASLAKGEVGIREKKAVPTLRQFAEKDFLPFAEATFAAKQNTLAYYRSGVKSLTAFKRLADSKLSEINSDLISAFVSRRQQSGLKVSSINRELQALRRMFALAQEWGKVEKALPRVRMLAGEAHRERVLTSDEESRYLAAAHELGEEIERSYAAALQGLRATLRDEVPQKPLDPFRLRDAVTLLLDCGMRPEECFRLEWEQVRDGYIEIQYGKTDNARRRIPLSPRVSAILAFRRLEAAAPFVFPAPTRSGHIEPSSLKKPHDKVCRAAKLESFPLYTLRHTCLTRWAPHMDPWTLATVAGHRDMSITKRYVHPQMATISAAMEKARSAQGSHTSSHTSQATNSKATETQAVIN